MSFPSGPSGGGPDKGSAPLPESIDRYEIRRRLGKGGQGAVYLAYDPHLDLEVALKVLHADVESTDFVERFKNEARTMVRLTHPNIVRVYDYNPTHPYIVMEHCNGGDLTEILRRREQIPLARIRRIVREVLSGIAAAHNHSPTILHRDIKPGNVLFHRGVARVADFGLAKVLGADTSLTHTRSVMGTIRYTSPEQCADPSRVDHRADLWSLGVLFHELLSWERPFDQPGDSFVNVAMRISAEPPRAPAVPLPEPLSKVLARAFDKNRDARFKTAEEMLEAFESAAEAVDPSGKRMFPDEGAVTPADRLVLEAVQLLETGNLDEAGARLQEVSSSGGDETLARYWHRRISEQQDRGGTAATVASPRTAVDSNPPAQRILAPHETEMLKRPTSTETLEMAPTAPIPQVAEDAATAPVPPTSPPTSSSPPRDAASKAAQQSAPRVPTRGAGPNRLLIWLPPLAVALVLAVVLVALLVVRPAFLFQAAPETVYRTSFIAPLGDAEITGAWHEDDPVPELLLTVAGEASYRDLAAGRYRLEWGTGGSVEFTVPDDGAIALFKPQDGALDELLAASSESASAALSGGGQP